MNILVIINPHSGKAKYGFFEKERFESIFNKYLSKEHSYEIFVSSSMEELEKNIPNFIKHFDIIAPTGGDGTLNHFINILIPFLSSKDIPIFPIGGGSLNVVQKNIIPSQRIGTAPRLLCDIVNAMANSPEPRSFVRRIRMIALEESGKTRYAFMFANGLIFRAMKIYYSKGVGPEVAFGTIVELFFKSIIGIDRHLFEYISCKIEIDGKSFPYDRTIACIGSSFRKMILFTKPFVASDKKEGFYFMATSDPVIPLALNFFWVVTGRKVLPKTFNGKVREVKLYFEGGFTLDGELFDRKEVQITLTEGPPVSFLTLPSTGHAF